jgi:hypothetical protein
VSASAARWQTTIVDPAISLSLSLSLSLWGAVDDRACFPGYGLLIPGAAVRPTLSNTVDVL